MFSIDRVMALSVVLPVLNLWTLCFFFYDKVFKGVITCYFFFFENITYYFKVFCFRVSVGCTYNNVRVFIHLQIERQFFFTMHILMNSVVHCYGFIHFYMF